jgi:ADP-sugar diphosphatase
MWWIGCDEFMKVFAYRHRIDKGTLNEWRGKLTGLREHGERITLKVVRLCDLWRETVDAKALCAVALWDGLKREGRV